jgi:hypothetical protein
MDFGYEVIRLWDIPAEQLLAGDLGMVPLAPLGKLAEDATFEDGLASIIQRLIERFQREAPPERAWRLLTAAYVLTGLLIPDRSAVTQLFRGVQAMRESSTYMGIIEDGQIEEAKKIILRQGRKRFGPPSEGVVATVNALQNLERLESLSDRLLDVDTWEELLAQPKA